MTGRGEFAPDPATPASGRFFLLWAAGLLVLYVYAILPRLVPADLAAMLPDFSRNAAPQFTRFAAGTAALLAGIALTLLAGRMPARVLAGFLRLGRLPGPRAIPLGWIVVGLGIFGLGLAGLMQPRLLACGAILLAATGLRGLGRRKAAPGGPGLSPLVLGLSAIAGWAALLLALAPEITQDPLRYHVFLPAQFLVEHRCYFMPEFFFWSYFSPIHALYGAGLSLGGESGAGPVNLAAGALGIAAACRIALQAGLPAADRRLHLALLISAPGLILISARPFVEHGHALYTLLALEWVLETRAPRTRRLRAAVMLAAQSLAIKYTAAFGVAGLVAAVWSLPDRRAWFDSLLRRPAAAAVAAAALGPWGVWRWWHTGDPVSPILARLGLPTLERGSIAALNAYYGFAGDAWSRWTGEPGLILRFPLEFAGAHETSWECPGPALPALLPVLFLAARFLPPAARALARFSTVSFVAWFVLFGGASPHYVAGLTGVWLAGSLASLAVLRPRPGNWIRGILAAGAGFQAVAALPVIHRTWGPRDVALGVTSPARYLEDRLKPAGVGFPIRRRLDELRAAEARGGTRRVLVTGDDHASYLAGRAVPDLELAPHPLLWRLAEESRDGDRVHRRLRQRGIGWMLYSLNWPLRLARADLTRPAPLSPRTLDVLQDFWRDWTDPVVGAYPSSGGQGAPAWIIRFRRTAGPGTVILDRWRHPEILPGTFAWIWPALARERDGDREGALAALRVVLDRHPDYAMVRFQAARLSFELNRPGEGRRDLAAAARRGWRLKGHGPASGRHPVP